MKKKFISIKIQVIKNAVILIVNKKKTLLLLFFINKNTKILRIETNLISLEKYWKEKITQLKIFTFRYNNDVNPNSKFSIKTQREQRTCVADSIRTCHL